MALDCSGICHLCSQNASLLLPGNRKLLYDHLINSLELVTRDQQNSMVLAQGEPSTKDQLQGSSSLLISGLSFLCESVSHSSHVIGLIVLNRLNLMQKNPWRIIKWCSTKYPSYPLPSVRPVSKITKEAVKHKGSVSLKSILPESYKTHIMERRQYLDLLRGDAECNKKHTQNIFAVREYYRNCLGRKKEHIREMRSSRLRDLRERCIMRKIDREATMKANVSLTERRDRNIYRKRMVRNRLFKQKLDAYLREVRRNQKLRATSIRHAHELMIKHKIHSLMEQRGVQAPYWTTYSARKVFGPLMPVSKSGGASLKDSTVSSNIEPAKQSSTLQNPCHTNEEEAALKISSSLLIPFIVRILPQLRL